MSTASKKTESTKDAAAKLNRQLEEAVAAGRETVETVVKSGTEVAAKGYEDWVAYGKDNVDAWVKSGSILAKGMQDINRAWFGLAQSTVDEGVTATTKMLGCKTVREVVEVQGDYTRCSYRKVVGESRKITDMGVKVAEDVANPLGQRVNATFERLINSSAA